MAAPRDLSILAKAIPGLSKIEEATAERLSCRVKPGLSFLTGSLATTIERGRCEELERLDLSIHSKGIGSSATVATEFVLREADGGTSVAWNANITELGGLLKPVGAGLVEAAAAKVIANAWVGFREALVGQR